MANTLDLGLFVLFIVLGFIPFLPGRIRLFAVISTFLFAGLGLAMASQWDVVVTSTTSAYNQTSTSSAIERNGTGALVSNVTETVTTQNPQVTEQIPVINRFHIPLAYTFFGLAILAFLIWIEEILGGLPI